MGYSWEDRWLSGLEIWTESRVAAHTWKYHLCKHDDEFWNTKLPPTCWINNPAAFPRSSVYPSVHGCRLLMYLKHCYCIKHHDCLILDLRMNGTRHYYGLTVTECPQIRYLPDSTYYIYKRSGRAVVRYCWIGMFALPTGCQGFGESMGSVWMWLRHKCIASSHDHSWQCWGVHLRQHVGTVLLPLDVCTYDLWHDENSSDRSTVFDSNDDLCYAHGLCC